ncbi:hypothetical protein NDU88_001950 [Pleurodeles waltl]|uniref:Secreted protein n=1 Tax=Pleurodeles waltl TaxID=8319 RepID=A0AAV7WNL4_PLEWA|nr:hypothetical protein NDU88_001950 [Pleurodeles waltl]
MRSVAPVGGAALTLPLSLQFGGGAPVGGASEVPELREMQNMKGIQKNRAHGHRADPPPQAARSRLPGGTCCCLFADPGLE